MILLASAGIICFVHAQMLDPGMDRDGEPFSYFSHPTDVVGVMDGREGTLITPEGYLYTGFAELMFFTGNPPKPVFQRVKTLEAGYLPLIRYSFSESGFRYDVVIFAATLDGRPESPLVNFVRVTVTNTGRTRRTAYFSAGVRYQNDANTDWGVGDNRFGRPAKPTVVGEYEQSGVEFSTEWEYAFSEDALTRDGRMVYLYPTSPSPQKMLTLKTGYNEPWPEGPMKLYVFPTTPVGIVMYRLPLSAGSSAVLDFKMPYEPMEMDSLEALRSSGFEEYRNRTVAFWETIFSRGLEIVVPEEKVVNTFKANLVYDLIARDKIDGFYVQKVNEFQYDAFWLRDAAYIVRMYDLSGYHEMARQCLDFFPLWQREDGNFLSQGGQYDGWGQALWAFGQHYRMTGDREFGLSVLPRIDAAVKWLHTARSGDPLNLVPVTTPGDNEGITGHVTGHNFWALIGLKNAVELARGAGREAEAQRYQDEYDDLFHSLVERLGEITKHTGGYIPPGLDSLGGQDWGNMMAVYPERILDPFDPMVSATLAATRAKYQEGIITYGDGRWLHHYLTMKNTETEIIRGEQQTALEEFYAMLVHTSSTHAGFEFSIRPWGTRDFGMNLAPHGWFAAKFRTLLRNMLVREEGSRIHLYSVISPKWFQEGSHITVRTAPTWFGTVSSDMKISKTRAVVSLTSSFRKSPDAFVLHVPWFLDVHNVVIDGRPAQIEGSTILAGPTAKTIEFSYRKKAKTPQLSYEHAVNEFKKEYRRRYEEFLNMGAPGNP